MATKTTTATAKATSTKATKGTKAATNGKATPAAATGPKPLGAVQVRLLTALSKASNGLSGKLLAEKAEVDPTAIGNQAGYRDPEINTREVHKFNLLNRGFVKIEQHDIKGRDTYVYVITAAGRKGLEKAKKEAAAK